MKLLRMAESVNSVHTSTKKRLLKNISNLALKGRILTIILSLIMIISSITAISTVLTGTDHSLIEQGNDHNVPSVFSQTNYTKISYVSINSVPGSVSGNLSGIFNGEMSVMVTFKLSNQSRLNSFLSNLSNPSSPQYHKYINREKFAQDYSPSHSLYRDALNYFYSFPDTSVTTYPDRISLTINAPANVVDRIFNTTIRNSSSNSSVYYASSIPSLPSAIGNGVSLVSGLTNQRIKLSLNSEQSGAIQGVAGTIPNQDGYPIPIQSSGTQYIYGSDLQVAYNEQSLLNVTYPTHEVIATILWSGQNSSGTPVGPFYPADINAYYNATLPSYEPHAKVYGVPINGAPKPGISSTYDVTGASGENTLDLEMVGSTAPGSSIYNVYGPNATYMNLNAAFAFILNPNASTPQLNNVSVISNSWGGPEYNDTAWYTYLQEAQTRGISVLASSGDSGDNPASSKYSSNPNYTSDYVQFPSAMAYNNFGVTAVGGTTLTLNSAMHIDNQTAWYESNQSTNGSPAGSTGGLSSVFPEPSWQKNTEANTVINGQWRGVPDISAIANNTIVYETEDGTSYYGNPYFNVYGGTSVASPVEAGIVAEMDAVLNHYNQSNLGYLNPMVYQIANRQISSLASTSTTGYLPTGKYNSSLPLTAFYDVKYGRNHVYNASFGYDLVTGWGSIDAYNLTMYLLAVNYSGKDFALNGVENTLNLSALNVTSYLYNSSTAAYSTLNTQFNASIQQNMFVADALGAPIYWIQNVIYINGSQQAGWTMNYTGWVVYPFYGLYPSQTVYEYSYPIGKNIHLPHHFKIKTWLSNVSVLDGQTMNFEVNSHVLQIPVPGASFIIGSHNYSYLWQGNNYYNGPFPNNKYPGGLDPQFSLVGGPSAGLGNFTLPTDGNMSAYIELMGTKSYIPAATASYNNNFNVDETGETSYNLQWAQTSSGLWEVSIKNGSQTQGVLSYSPQAYGVTFNETGLPSGSEWSVNLSNGLSFNSTSSSISFTIPNGTYSYTVSTSDKTYSPLPSSGSFNVNGASLSEPVTFSNRGKYPITFTEIGLTQGTVWWINDSQAYPVTGKYFYQTTGSNISFDLPNGTYTFLAVPSPSYIGFSFTFTVDGSENISIPFSSGSANAYQVSFVETGLPTGTTWYANITGYPSSGPMTSSSYAIVLPNGTYSYSVSPVSGYTVKQNGTFSVGGTEVNISVDYVKNTTLNLNFTPAGSAVYVNANSVLLSSSGSASLSLVPGNYYVNASLSGYRSFSDFYTLVSGKTYFVNVTLASLSIYGYLNGTVMPGNATVSAGGLVIPVHSGKFNESIAPGTYYVSFTANGYNSIVKEINITAGKTSTLDVSLTPATNSVTLSGHIAPDNASLVVNGFVAYVNSTGYYSISVPAGTYTISVYEGGYFPYSENVTLNSSTMMNFTLVKEPKATSTTSANDTTATGYNVTVSNLTTGNGLVSVSFNSSANGTLIVQIPYTDMKNATISEILNSTVYINGVPYRNYSISISSDYTIILKVYGLKSGDPTLYWKYSPNAVVPKPAPAPTVSPSPSLTGYEVMGAIIAIGIVAVASIAVFGRRRR